MERKSSKILLGILILAVLLIPVLCLSGGLDHDCPCSETGCGHEDECASDPCAVMLRGNEAQGNVGLAALETTLAAGFHAIISTIGALDNPSGSFLLRQPPPCAARIPFHHRDMPPRI